MDTLEDIGTYLRDVPYFPVMHIVHCYATSSSLRSQQGAVEFAHRHPLASLAGNLLIVNAGGVLSSAALGLPLIGPFANVANTLTALAIWWMVYFGPGDMFFKLYKFKPLQYTMTMVRETRRCKKILDTTKLAMSIMPDKWIVAVLVGALGGCSGKFMQTTEESLRKSTADVTTSEFIRISFVTKASLLISTFYTLVYMDIVPLSISQALLICAVSLVSINLMMVLAGMPDPFHPMAKATWKVMTIATKAPETPDAASKAKTEKKE